MEDRLNPNEIVRKHAGMYAKDLEEDPEKMNQYILKLVYEAQKRTGRFFEKLISAFYDYMSLPMFHFYLESLFKVTSIIEQKQDDQLRKIGEFVVIISRRTTGCTRI
jgi:hypothetical protein